ncbi:class C sortase [Streptococcus sp. E17BB]|uniref:class C sortase n=1 Tax=Streptococcus sp. E17BB TaxID=3278714 RepID=UPI00359E2D0C
MPTKRKKTLKQRILNGLFALLFLIGLSILAYPLVSQIYYQVKSSQQVGDFQAEKEKLTDSDIEERMRLAAAFNASLTNVIEGDFYDDREKKEGIAAYARMLELNEKIGHVEIPTINVDLPIYAGTSEDVLQMGAGHLEGTSLPIGGNSTHSVITAHTGLPNAKMFTDLTKLKKGDKFYVHNLKETLAYQVDQIKVVEPSQFEDLLIAPGHDYVTLLTCTPYMINTHRLLVRGHRVEYVKAVEEEFILQNKISFLYKYLFFASLVLIAILLYIIYRLRKRKKE